MPWGCVDLSEEASFILSAFEGVPASVLDVGVGFGSFGMAYRSLQLRMGSLIDKEQWSSHQDLMIRENWVGVLDGIDVRDYSRSPGWLFYNRIHVGDALELLGGMKDGSYDAVVANDIIEHFTPATAAVFATELQRVAKHVVIVGYPLTVSEVGDEGPESHRLVADPATILNGFTHRLNLREGWAISFKLLESLRALPGRG
jgi:hypothetical protein